MRRIYMAKAICACLFAGQSGMVEPAGLLIAREAHASVVDGKGNTLSIDAGQYDRPDMVSPLWDQGVDVNTANREG